MEVSIALCDDEEVMLNILKEKIVNHMKKTFFCYTITTFYSAEQLLASKMNFDILFLDIQMEKLNGIEAAKLYRKKNKNTSIVFITISKEYVFEAFDVEAVNYLLKPLSDKKFSQTFARIIQKLIKTQEQYLAIQQGKIFRKIKCSDILYAEVVKRKIYLHLIKETIDYYETIEHLAKQLPTYFYRCHRSYLINLNYIKCYKENNVILENNEYIPVSRLRQQEFSIAVLTNMKNRGL